MVVQPWHGAEAARTALIDGASDLAISVFPPTEDDIHREELLTEHYVVAMRAGHPAASRFKLEKWLRYPHIIVSGRGDTRTPLDAELARRGLERRVGGRAEFPDGSARPCPLRYDRDAAFPHHA